MNERLLPSIDAIRTDHGSTILWARLMHRRIRVKMRHAETVRQWGMLAYASEWRDLGGEA